MLYLIHAADQIYTGLHGLEDWFITDCVSEDVAWEEAEEASLDIINSYSGIKETLDDDIESWRDDNMSEDDLEELIYDIYHEDILAEVWKINEESIKGLSLHELDILLDRDPEEFIEKYCFQ